MLSSYFDNYYCDGFLVETIMLFFVRLVSQYNTFLKIRKYNIMWGVPSSRNEILMCDQFDIFKIYVKCKNLCRYI